MVGFRIAPSTGVFGGIRPIGRRMDAMGFLMYRVCLLATPVESEERRIKAASGCHFVGDFLLVKHKFARSEFEQPIGWPEGRKPGMVFVAKVSRLSVLEPT